MLFGKLFPWVGHPSNVCITVTELYLYISEPYKSIISILGDLRSPSSRITNVSLYGVPSEPLQGDPWNIRMTH
jgi:hypothetical protein